MTLNDVTLPTGGGKSGKEPLAVPKDTTISKLSSATRPICVRLIVAERTFSLFPNGHAAAQGYLRRGRRNLPARTLGGIEHQPLALYPVQPVSIQV